VPLLQTHGISSARQGSGRKKKRNGIGRVPEKQRRQFNGRAESKESGKVSATVGGRWRNKFTSSCNSRLLEDVLLGKGERFYSHAY